MKEKAQGTAIVSTTQNDCGIHTTADNTTGREILTEGYPIMQIDITGYVTD